MVGRTLGHYRVESKLGEGGMGVVYKAHDAHLDRPVAIKVLPADAEFSAERRRRFAQEAKAASALNQGYCELSLAPGTARDFLPGAGCEERTGVCVA